MKVSIEHYPAHRKEAFANISVPQMAGILGRIAGEVGSTIELLPDGGDYPHLVVAVDAGHFTVTAFVGEDELYDRVGNQTAVDKVDLVIGGQLIEGVPGRFVLDRDQVQQVLNDFIASRRWVVSNDWVRQDRGAGCSRPPNQLGPGVSRWVPTIGWQASSILRLLFESAGATDRHASVSIDPMKVFKRAADRAACCGPSGKGAR